MLDFVFIASEVNMTRQQINYLDKKFLTIWTVFGDKRPKTKKLTQHLGFIEEFLKNSDKLWEFNV